MPVPSTNLKRNLGNTDDSFCNWVQLKTVNVSFFSDVGELTAARASPYLNALSKNFSIDPLIRGEYSTSNPSS